MKYSIFKFRINATRALGSLIILVVQAIFIQSSVAQRVQPMVFELEPFGPKSSATLRIENTQQQPLTVELIPTKITMDEYGVETLTSAEDDFLIYPPQTLIEKGRTQVVRVKYIGDPQISESQSYRVSVKQLPINIRAAGHAGVGMVINFNTLVNVSPAGSKSELLVSSISSMDDGRWAVVIENSGNRFARLSTTSWEVFSTVDASKTKHIKSLEVGNLANKNLVAPHSKLSLAIPAIEGFVPENTKIVITQ